MQADGTQVRNLTQNPAVEGWCRDSRGQDRALRTSSLVNWAQKTDYRAAFFIGSRTARIEASRAGKDPTAIFDAATLERLRQEREAGVRITEARRVTKHAQREDHEGIASRRPPKSRLALRAYLHYNCKYARRRTHD
jgi:hypothetical protein